MEIMFINKIIARKSELLVVVRFCIVPGTETALFHVVPDKHIN
jgi:hypothetical protein